jgi:two-component system sensor histidine kinase HydH
MSAAGLHPIFRYAGILILAVAMFATITVSGLVNPHSTTWLFGIYLTVLLLIVSLRNARKSKLHRSYSLYLSMLCQYLFIVWFLHVWIPGPSFQTTKTQVLACTRLFSIGGIYNAIAHFHFTLRFAEVRARALRWFEGIGWVLSTILAITNVTGHMVKEYLWTGITWVPTLTGLYVQFFYLTTFLLTASLLVPIFKIPFCKTRRQRLQLFYYLLGACPLWISCWGHFLISVGINIYPAGGLIFISHAAIMAYAVFKHNLFDFTIVIRRGLVYAILCVATGAMYGSVLWLLSFLMPAPHTSLISGFIFIFLIALLYAPLLGYLQSKVDRLFFRSVIVRQEMVDQFAREAASTIDLSSLATSLCELLDRSLKPRSTSLYLEDEKGRMILFASYCEAFKRETWPEGCALPEEYATRLSSSVVRVRANSQTSQQQFIQFTEGNDALLAPIRHRNRTFGCLVLEPRRADEPYHEDDIKLVGNIAVQSAIALQNATAFAQLEHFEEFTRKMLEGLSAGVLVVSSMRRIIRANRAAHLICLRIHESFPQTLDGLESLHPDLAREISGVIADNSPRDEVEISLSDGTRRRVLLMSARQIGKSNDASLFLVIFHDISHYKEMEATARRQESLARLGEEISKINHEIKNVLQPVRHLMEGLSRLESSEPLVKRATAFIPERLEALDRLFANLRDVARPIVLRIRDTDLEDTVSSTLNDIQQFPNAKSVQFKMSFPPGAKCCQGDGHWLRLVVYNLIRNSLEATVDRPHPEISIESANGGGTIRLSIRDNGCGMDEEALKSIFKLFYSTKGEAGTGLGLSVSRRIIELHGGQLTFESQADKGTCATIELPLNQPGQQAVSEIK